MKLIWLKFGCLLLLGLLAAGCGPLVKKESPPADLPSSPNHPTASSSPVTENFVTPSGKKPQFVVLAFDGSHSLDMWQKTLDFSQQMSAQGTKVKFTYFLSGVYFLNYRKAHRYVPPDGQPGHSLIGFADSNKDVEKRVAFVNRAIAEGHEIGSHLNGHFDGTHWSQQQWQVEFNAFNNLVFSIPQNNDVSAKDAARYTLNLTAKQLVGLRAPELGSNPAMFKVLKEQGYTYDTSLNGKANAWPEKLDNGIWEFPLAQINYATTTKKILSMDYNFYYKQSNAKDVAVKGTPVWNAFYNDTYNSYLNYFSANYNANRAPVYIGSHFSEWNDGVYWEAMRDFAAEVCGKPEVYCVTFGELEQYMESQPVN
ncbi:MAG TPA: hypothetical protein VE973_02025 [Candidatus Limnocylindria bacterium]|nr:hypothetical protein [Candidatus Limnocylindria bacterium]